MVNNVVRDIDFRAFHNNPRWFDLHVIRDNIDKLAGRDSFYLYHFTPAEKNKVISKVISKVHQKFLDSLKESYIEV